MIPFLTERHLVPNRETNAPTGLGRASNEAERKGTSRISY